MAKGVILPIDCHALHLPALPCTALPAALHRKLNKCQRSVLPFLCLTVLLFAQYDHLRVSLFVVDSLNTMKRLT